MGLSLGQPAADLLEGLASFQGAGRRFELKASIAGIRVIDDYGHHPTEIDVTLTAARRYAGEGRVLVIFQPHRYTRTQAFLDQFAATLDLADLAILLEIYPASEKPIAGGQRALENFYHPHWLSWSYLLSRWHTFWVGLRSLV